MSPISHLKTRPRFDDSYAAILYFDPDKTKPKFIFTAEDTGTEKAFMQEFYQFISFINRCIIRRHRAFSLSPRSPQRLAGASESAGEDILAALRGFCLIIHKYLLQEYRQKNPLKYSIPPHFNRMYLNLGIRPAKNIFCSTAIK